MPMAERVGSTRAFTYHLDGLVASTRPVSSVMVAALEGTGADESDGMPFDPLATTYHAAYQPGPLHRYQDPYVSPHPPTHTAPRSCHSRERDPCH
jgi:hypothetical protein